LRLEASFHFFAKIGEIATFCAQNAHSGEVQIHPIKFNHGPPVPDNGAIRPEGFAPQPARGFFLRLE
jgi:hypothetical protein